MKCFRRLLAGNALSWLEVLLVRDQRHRMPVRTFFDRSGRIARLQTSIEAAEAGLRRPDAAGPHSFAFSRARSAAVAWRA